MRRISNSGATWYNKYGFNLRGVNFRPFFHTIVGMDVHQEFNFNLHRVICWQDVF